MFKSQSNRWGDGVFSFKHMFSWIRRYLSNCPCNTGHRIHDLLFVIWKFVTLIPHVYAVIRTCKWIYYHIPYAKLYCQHAYWSGLPTRSASKQIDSFSLLTQCWLQAICLEFGLCKELSVSSRKRREFLVVNWSRIRFQHTQNALDLLPS